MNSNFITRHWPVAPLDPTKPLDVHLYKDCIVVPELGEAVFPRNIEYSIDEVDIELNYGDDANVIDHRLQAGEDVFESAMRAKYPIQIDEGRWV